MIMSKPKPDVDDVIKYLSTKFNKIFCDREFVCCVTQDFQTILDNKNKCFVLLFPALGPIYLKAVRYQARIFNLAVFNVSACKFKSVAVCHKDHLVRKCNDVMEVEVMADTSRSRKRPERQLYVPPAQRTQHHTLASKKPTKTTKSYRQHSVEIEKNNENQDALQHPPLKDIHLTLDMALNIHYNLLPCHPCVERHPHHRCAFRVFLTLSTSHSSKLNNCIPLYSNNDFSRNLSQIKFLNYPDCKCSRAYPMFDFDLPGDEEVSIIKTPSAIFRSQKCNVDSDTEEDNSLIFKVACDKKYDSNESFVVDLSLIGSGHYCIVSFNDGEYIYECQEEHDAVTCCVSKSVEMMEARKSQKEPQQPERVLKIGDVNKKAADAKTCRSPNDVIKNHLNSKEQKSSDKNEHEQEKEIMRKTKENINRKTRPIMKYVDDTNNTLKIDRSEGVNNWEDLLDDDGHIQDKLFTEIADKVGTDVTIVKANEDYSAYTSKPISDLEHVVELYDFPSSFETHDLVQAFSEINSDAMYIKWVDDTHALLVLGSSIQAQKAVGMKNPLIKARPMFAASAVAVDVANKSDLKPAMKRPPTNLQTARRLITSHLGAKSRLTKEQIAREKQDLKDAKEMRRLIKQSEKDAWEGNLCSSIP